MNYDEKNFYLLNMGRIVKDKGIDELTEAFVKLHGEQPGLRLVILGQFEDKLDPISPTAREILTKHPAIIHVAWNENVECFMHLSQLMIHASYREGFPNTLLQAGAMLCPIICSAITGNVDIVTDKETGLLFQPRNADDLYAKLKYALAHKPEMQGYALKLRKRIENEFSQMYVHQCMAEKYRELLGRQS
jgi:glycosyltransferase involved in cell wall biosynthesis